MKVQHLSPRVLQVTVHAYEMAALTAAGRWIVEGAEGELTPGIRDQLEKVLASYEEALEKIEEVRQDE